MEDEAAAVAAAAAALMDAELQKRHSLHLPASSISSHLILTGHIKTRDTHRCTHLKLITGNYGGSRFADTDRGGERKTREEVGSEERKWI